MDQHIVRITIELPAELLAAIDRIVHQGRARSRDELIYRTLQRELAVQEHDEIDAAFAAMVEDAAYQVEAEAIAGEFSHADWEALRLGERSFTGDDDAAR